MLTDENAVVGTTEEEIEKIRQLEEEIKQLEEQAKQAESEGGAESETQEATEAEEIEEEVEEEIEVILPEYEIKVTADHLSVYVRLADNGVASDVVLDETDVYALLEKNLIKHGIVDGEIKEFCSNGKFFQWHKVAFGTHAIDGQDGTYALTFDPEWKGPHEKDDGTIDYKELDLVKNVYEGEILCNIVLPTEGINGVNVFGGSISARDGKFPDIGTGSNAVLTEDKTEIRAEKDGCVYFQGGKVLVEEAFNVKQDVCLETGNIDFNGSVNIAGNVLQGFKVTAKNDIFVKGRVEGVEMKAGGNIVIAGGITGMGSAIIEAEGDISAKFIESANVTCGGNLTCEFILKANVKAEKSIYMKGDKGTIVGGTTLAGEEIVAKNLGSIKYPKQEVSVRKNWKFYEQEIEDDDEDGGVSEQKKAMEDRENAKKQKAELQKKLAAAEEYVEVFANKIKEENALGANKSIASLKEYMVKKSEFTALVGSLKNLLESYKTDDFNSSITCKGCVFPGVRLRIDNCWMNVETEIENQKFYVHDDEIVVGSVLPGGGE